MSESHDPLTPEPKKTITSRPTPIPFDDIHDQLFANENDNNQDIIMSQPEEQKESTGIKHTDIYELAQALGIEEGNPLFQNNINRTPTRQHEIYKNLPQAVTNTEFQTNIDSTRKREIDDNNSSGDSSSRSDSEQLTPIKNNQASDSSSDSESSSDSSSESESNQAHKTSDSGNDILMQMFGNEIVKLGLNQFYAEDVQEISAVISCHQSFQIVNDADNYHHNLLSTIQTLLNSLRYSSRQYGEWQRRNVGYTSPNRVILDSKSRNEPHDNDNDNHANTIKIFPYLKSTQVHTHNIPMTQIMIKNALNERTSRYLEKDTVKNPQTYNAADIVQILAIRQLFKKAKGIDALRQKLDETNHAFLWFPKIDRTQATHFKGFDETDCIKKVTKMKQENRELLLHTIYTSEMTKYGKFTKPEIIIRNTKIMEYLQRATKYTLTFKEIENIINIEWYDIEMSDIDDYDDDDDDDGDLFFDPLLHKKIDNNKSHPMFKPPTHEFINENNKISEAIPTLHIFSDKPDKKSARFARETFTNVVSKIKSKKHTGNKTTRQRYSLRDNRSNLNDPTSLTNKEIETIASDETTYAQRIDKMNTIIVDVAEQEQIEKPICIPKTVLTISALIHKKYGSMSYDNGCYLQSIYKPRSLLKSPPQYPFEELSKAVGVEKASKSDPEWTHSMFVDLEVTDLKAAQQLSLYMWYRLTENMSNFNVGVESIKNDRDAKKWLPSLNAANNRTGKNTIREKHLIEIWNTKPFNYLHPPYLSDKLTVPIRIYIHMLKKLVCMYCGGIDRLKTTIFNPESRYCIRCSQSVCLACEPYDSNKNKYIFNYLCAPCCKNPIYSKIKPTFSPTTGQLFKVDEYCRINNIDSMNDKLNYDQSDTRDNLA
eukprot:209068_1